MRNDVLRKKIIDVRIKYTRVFRFYLKIFITALITIVLFLILGEIYLRDFTYYGISHGIWIDESVNSITNKGDFLFEPKSYEADLKADSRYTGDKKVLRLTVLGDSIADGGELNPEEKSFSVVLKDKIEESSGMHIQLYVFAMGGYSTVQEVAGYEKYSKYFMPDVVILSFCHNDLEEASFRIVRSGNLVMLAFYNGVIPYFEKIPFNSFLSGRFFIFRMINGLFIDLFNRFGLPPAIRYNIITREKIYKNFEKLSLLTRETETPVIVLDFPYLSQDYWNHTEKNNISETVEEWCSEFNFSYIGMLAPYSVYDPVSLRADPKDSCHPNALGHSIAADTLFDYLSDNGYIR